ncbi:hypothetical protein CHH55_23340 [Niallia circulans]|uniref:hypothetical protein n=1 Tax=Niallia circulans TaxID=1397 RepID=UPI000BA741E9|nr:hypothetical protein [Niallia circulans]PAD85467.1 hypothetical protein CHH55_23340 [Niallia circulans]
MKKFREKVYCRKCKNKTNHGIILNHLTSGEEEEAGYYWSDNYIIAQCLGCDTIVFIRDFDDSTMQISYYDEINDEYVDLHLDDIKVYLEEPIVNKKQNEYDLESFYHLPELLETLYKQVIANYELKYYLLAAAGLRMITEGICNHLGIIDGYILDESTNTKKLKKDGTILRKKNLAVE